MTTQLHKPLLSAASVTKQAPTHKALRVATGALAALVALTAIQGAIFVVPTMPTFVLHQAVLALFPDFTIPALG